MEIKRAFFETPDVLNGLGYRIEIHLDAFKKSARIPLNVAGRTDFSYRLYDETETPILTIENGEANGSLTVDIIHDRTSLRVSKGNVTLIRVEIENDTRAVIRSEVSGLHYRFHHLNDATLLIEAKIMDRGAMNTLFQRF